MPISEGSHLIDYDTFDNPLYEGWALRTGADTSESIWKIKRYTWATGIAGEQIMTEESSADGNLLYDNEWDNRATLTYVVAI